ncbi:DNA processing protein DprA [Spirochaetia bacterium]|nr:DNA processing protein DprA [Spirochaetia bacterium]
MDDNRGLLDLLINRIPGISAVQKIALATQFDREDRFTRLSKRDIEGILEKVPGGQDWTMDELRAQAEQDAALAQRSGIAWVSCVSAEYPPLLRELYDPPALLFYRGPLPNPELPLAAVVGTRKPSGNAAIQAYDICRELGRHGVPVVSGLALGIDAMAHRGNLEGGGATVAVLGSGLDQIYPSSNRFLARRILENGGTLVSEYGPGVGPMKWHFPARNRIISGLSRGTLVVEAPASSGALITAQFALEQGRDLWVARAGLALPWGEGTVKLAADGGKVIASAAAILEEWGIPINTETRENGGGNALASSLAASLNIKL